MAAKTVSTIKINLTAGTTDLLIGIDRANAKVLQFGRVAGAAMHAPVSGVQATSAALRVMEGGLNNNLRAAERFIANVAGLGPVLQSVFPVVGGLAFLGLLGKMGDEAYKFYVNLRDASDKSNNAFRELSAPMRLFNDELLVTDDRLQMNISKLEGRRQNTLKLALDEARVAADKLADALDGDLKKIAKVLDENKVGWFERFTGTAQTTDIKELVSGKSGVAGMLAEEAAITRQGQLQIDQAALSGNLKAQEAARLKLNNDLIDFYAKKQAIVNGLLKDSLALQQSRSTVAAVEGPSYPGTGSGTGQLDVSRRVAELKELNDRLQDMRVRVQLQAKVDSDTAKSEALEAAAAGAKLDRPFAAKIAELQAQADATAVRLKAAGLDAASQSIAKAQQDALIAVAEVNRGLEKQHNLIGITAATKLNGVSIESLTTSIAKNESEAAWITKLTEAKAKISDQIQSQQMLNGAISRGYDAQKKVNVEIALMKEFGAVAYNDPTRQADIQTARVSALAAEEAKHGEEIAKNSLALSDQIGLEVRLSQVQSEGAAAVRLATLQHTIALMRLNDETQENINLEVARFNAENSNQANTALAKIDEQIQALKRLNAAELEGADAKRKAELENKLAALDREGNRYVLNPAGILEESPEAKDLREQSALEQQKSVLDSKISAERVRNIDEQIKRLVEARDTLGDSLGIEMKLRDLEKERLQIQAQEVLAQGRARDGVRAFFIEMQEQAKTTAQIIYEAMNSALDKSSETLAKMMTEKKPKGGWGAEWGKEFQGIGEQMVQGSIKSALQKSLGVIGQKLGITGKPDGTRPNPFWVSLADGGGKLGPNQVSIPFFGSGKGGGLFGSGSQGGGIFSLPGNNTPGWLSKLFGGASDSSSITLPFFGGGMASGGYPSPDKAYLIGEDGPEIMTGLSGRIMSNSASRRALATAHGTMVVNNTIDARGADLGAYNRIQRALEMVHRDSVTNAVQASHERARRVPAGGR